MHFSRTFCKRFDRHLYPVDHTYEKIHIESNSSTNTQHPFGHGPIVATGPLILLISFPTPGAEPFGDLVDQQGSVGVTGAEADFKDLVRFLGSGK